MRCRALAPFVLALLSSGCLAVSLQPAYDADSVVFNAALVGRWVNAEDGTTATVARGEWRSYKIAYADRFGTRSLQGNLTKVGESTFLDVTEMRGEDPGPYLVPVHGVFRISLEGDTMEVAMLDYNWFVRAVARKSIAPLAAAIDDRRNVVLTSPTAELRRWLARAPEDAFSAPETFTRARQ